MAHIPESELFDKLLQKARCGCVFRILVLDPASRFASERRKDGGAYTPCQMRHMVERMIRLKEELGEKRENVRLAVYDEYPVWCVGIVDAEFSFLSFYGRGRSGLDSPAILLKSGPHSFHEACVLHFDKLWERARKVESASDLGRRPPSDVVEPAEGNVGRSATGS
jgi:hypothetical protein